MTTWQLDTPVALFVFNRPGVTKRTFQAIADVEPSELLVVADGPREGYPEDEAKCAAVRSYIEDAVDWDCDLRRNYADTNLGLHERFTTGLEWIFTTESESIILEDDCLPNEEFFRFCETMLAEYRGDERIMEITGTNHLGEWKSDTQDYHFSYYGSIWGWATWRESWEKYDAEMSLWEDPEVRSRLRDVIADKDQADYLEYIYAKAFENLDTWDYPWGFSRHINSALSVVPAKNLVTNIGFGAEATNTTAEATEMADVTHHSMSFPIERNPFVAVDRAYDKKFHKMRPISHRNRLLRSGREAYEHLVGTLR